MRIVAGIDGGGTYTRAALVTEEGKVLGIGAAGESNYDYVGVETARDNIGLAVQAAWSQAGMEPKPCDAVFLGMAGVVSDSDRATIRGMALDLELAPKDRIAVDHDISIALAGALAGRPGVVLIVGTGSAAYGRNAKGETWRAGGWGQMLDDIGSAYDLGVQSMVAAVREADGRDAPTSLTPKILSALGLGDIQDIMRKLYFEGCPRSEIAALAPHVTEAAAKGDKAAQKIIGRGVEELAHMTHTAAEKLGFLPGAVPVSVTGGLAHSGPTFKNPLYAAIRKKTPGAEIVEPILPSVIGAALLALDMIGVKPSDKVVSALKAGADRKPAEAAAEQDASQASMSFDPASGTIAGAPAVGRSLSDLRGCFADEKAYEKALAKGDELIYTVVSVEPARGEGQLHFGVGMLKPGRVGDEYYMTKGHFHAWRPAAEIYVGLGGEGAMLLEDEATGECTLAPMTPNSVVYVPGSTAHRTVNTGDEPLVYVAIYPSNAGHDYRSIADRNFRQVVVRIDGKPAAMDRGEYLKRIGGKKG